MSARVLASSDAPTFSRLQNKIKKGSEIKISIRMEGYHYKYHSASGRKAVCVRIGAYKLYFSYNTLIVFETPTDQYITAKKHSFTTANHKSSARSWEKRTHTVDQKVLELITLTEMLKQPFKEANSHANLYCERVH